MTDRPNIRPSQFTDARARMVESHVAARAIENPSELRAMEGMSGFHGIDLYSTHTSAYAVLRYLDEIDPEAAAVARQRYECLMPWQTTLSSTVAPSLAARSMRARTSS